MKALLSRAIALFKTLSAKKGFCPFRVTATLVYLLVLVYSAPLFTSSVGQYAKQAVSLVLFGGSLFLLIKSLKKLFDRRTRDIIAKFISRITDKVNNTFARLGRKLVHALGIDRIRAYGEEHDFVFGERRGKGKRHGKLKNPLYWQDQVENDQRVRYIFIEYMIKQVREGYTIKPSKTPKDMKKDLASGSECETDRLLFDSYEIARYSGGREKISDSAVDELTEFMEIRKKKH